MTDLLETMPGTAEVFTRFGEDCARRFGWRIYTVFSWEHGDRDVLRVWSNNRQKYPFPAFKPMGPTQWGQDVLYAGRSWEGFTSEDMRFAFPDHELIASFGCASCLSAPILENAKVVGAVSILDVEGAYRPGDSEMLLAKAYELVEPIRSAKGQLL